MSDVTHPDWWRPPGGYVSKPSGGFTLKPSRVRTHGLSKQDDGYDTPADTVDLVPRGLPSDGWWAEQAGTALGDWLLPLHPVALPTMNALDPLGLGSWKFLMEQGSELWAHMSDQDPARIGGLGFTQPNERGVGVHFHGVLFGPAGSENVNRVEWSRRMELKGAELHRLELGYTQLENQVRVECRAPWGVDRSGVSYFMSYCYRYVNRVVDGGHFEFGAPLDELFRIAAGTDTQQLALRG